ncbi:MAG: aminotransferase class I/II-fold pyridoxal phosphate-dependent enzyme [Candidatus Melainabacteria bacterium]|nr:aminotransferase class I/II-fold pyridoxal phosphate-dependent enzyme [Candidatus Melainabacteria bacterium]
MTEHFLNDEPLPDWTVSPASPLDQLPTYVFATLDAMKARVRERGVDLIDLGMGSPDMPIPSPIVEAMVAGVRNPENHRYPNFSGKQRYREAIANWFSRRFNVALDVNREIQPVIGTKSGLANLSFAYSEPGSITLVPSLHYPVHARASLLVGGQVYLVDAPKAQGYLPDLDSIPKAVLEKARLLFTNYPNNPSTATADLAFFDKLVHYCRKHNLVAVSDLAYSEIGFDGYRSPSIFEVPGAKDVAVEFHSFSKTFNMAGCRMGFAVGNAQVIATLHKMKTNVDYGTVPAFQDACSVALDNAESLVPPIVAAYQARRDVLVKGFQSLGWPVVSPKATFYLWLPVPNGFDADAWCRYLIEEAGVVVTPGSAFGDAGKQHFRVSLVSPVETLQAAIARLQQQGIRYEANQYEPAHL